jgi:hypothetical protein
MNYRALTTAVVASSIALLGCRAQFDLSPIKELRVPTVNVYSATSYINVEYVGKDWSITFPPGWIIGDRNKKLNDDATLDVDAVFDVGEGKTIVFIASSISFDDVPIDADTFALAAIMLMERNGLRVDDNLALKFNGVNSSLTIAAHIQKGILVLQLAVMHGTIGHMFRCVSSDVDLETIANACNEIFNSIKLIDGAQSI